MKKLHLSDNKNQIIENKNNTADYANAEYWKTKYLELLEEYNKLLKKHIEQ